MVNKVTLIGNLGRDPELFQPQSGQAVARLSIATNEVWMKEAERQGQTKWHRVAKGSRERRDLGASMRFRSSERQRCPSGR